ncbi:hypothetical protein [Saccharospirillum sp.]|uniref:hypothetical protein n=1 Tax=Saccharospirillum sp. TaxID=2033801 RepID=UPI0034A06341
MIIQISSHRRSGTHALIDLVRSRFSIENDFFHLEDVLDWPLAKLEESSIIVKTHEPEPEKKLHHFIKLGHVSEEKAQDISDKTINIHAYRHPRNVFRSLYYFNIKGHEPVFQIPEKMLFLEFLKQEGVQDADPNENRVQFWQRCVRNWAIREDVLALKYYDIASGTEEIVNALSEHLQLAPVSHKGISQESTAIGRETTKTMGGRSLWTSESELFYEGEIDHELLQQIQIEES